MNKSETMTDYNLIGNPVVRQAVEAWQAADLKKWLSFFTEKPLLLDDGQPRDFKRFCETAIAHEHFKSIDKVEEEGTAVYGQWHSDSWGDFKTYFRFHLDEQGKVSKLEIGQAKY